MLPLASFRPIGRPCRRYTIEFAIDVRVSHDAAVDTICRVCDEICEDVAVRCTFLSIKAAYPFAHAVRAVDDAAKITGVYIAGPDAYINERVTISIADTEDELCRETHIRLPK